MIELKKKKKKNQILEQKCSLCSHDLGNCKDFRSAMSGTKSKRLICIFSIISQTSKIICQEGLRDGHLKVTSMWVIYKTIDGDNPSRNE